MVLSDTIRVTCSRDALIELVSGRLDKYECENPLPEEWKCIHIAYDSINDVYNFLFDNGNAPEAIRPEMYIPIFNKITTIEE